MIFDVNKPPRRIMLKLSGEALKGKQDFGFDIDFLDGLSKKIIELTQRGIQCVVILWGGNFFRGATWEAKGMDRATWDYIGMLATVMNWIALGEALERNKQPVKVMSSVEMPKIAELFIRKKAVEYLNEWKVVICVAGTWNPYFTTDTSAVQKALELECEYLVKWTKVDWVYDKDPMKSTDAVKFPSISYKDALARGLNIMDHSAIAMAMDYSLPLFICKIWEINLIWTENVNGSKIDMV